MCGGRCPARPCTGPDTRFESESIAACGTLTLTKHEAWSNSSTKGRVGWNGPPHCSPSAGVSQQERPLFPAESVLTRIIGEQRRKAREAIATRVAEELPRDVSRALE